MFKQILAHFIGDYFLQSTWMANNKTKYLLVAEIHALVYFTPFLILFHPSLLASLVMIGTHFFIDHWRLARFFAYASTFLAPPWAWKPWSECAGTGYHKDVPPFIAMWLMIIIDNTMHVTINALALAYL